MSDTSILKHITALVEEENKLRADTTAPQQHSDRIKHIGEELDQAWDLLRQRRAAREFGDDPDQAKPRGIDVVERYLN